MELYFTDILVVIGGIIVLILILKFIGQVVVRILTILIVVLFIVYVLFFWRGGILDVGNTDFILIEMQQKYCEGSSYDAVTCDCIIKPLIEEIENEYTNDQIVKLQTDKIQSLTVILKSLNTNKTEIINCLSENNSLEKFDDFVDELHNLDLKNELRETWQKINK